MRKPYYTYKHIQKHIELGLAMTNTPSPKLTPQAQVILDALREAGDWVGRSELATKLNKNALNKWDVVLLGKLSDAGLIEMRQIPHHGPIGYEWQYRAIPNTQR